MRLVLDIFGIIYILLSVIGTCLILYFEREYLREAAKNNKKEFFRCVVRIPILLLFSPIISYCAVLEHDYF